MFLTGRPIRPFDGCKPSHLCHGMTDGKTRGECLWWARWSWRQKDSGQAEVFLGASCFFGLASNTERKKNRREEKRNKRQKAVPIISTGTHPRAWERVNKDSSAKVSTPLLTRLLDQC